MKNIDKILKTITLLYYIFVVVFAFSFIFKVVAVGVDEFMRGFNEGQNAAHYYQSGWELLLNTLLGLVLLSSMVAMVYYFVRLLIHIAKSIARKDIFNSRIVKLLNRFVIVYLTFSVFAAIIHVVIAGSELYDIDVVYLVELLSSTVFNSVLLLLFAQIIKIGNILKSEVDLTV